MEPVPTIDLLVMHIGNDCIVCEQEWADIINEEVE